MRLMVSQDGFRTFFQEVKLLNRGWIRGRANNPAEAPLSPIVPFVATTEDASITGTRSWPGWQADNWTFPGTHITATHDAGKGNEQVSTWTITIDPRPDGLEDITWTIDQAGAHSKTFHLTSQHASFFDYHGTDVTVGFITGGDIFFDNLILAEADKNPETTISFSKDKVFFRETFNIDQGTPEDGTTNHRDFYEADQPPASYTA